MKTTANTSIEEITKSLADNEAVRHNLTGGGRLHIDRQLPFLALYRQQTGSTDKGTNRLLLGEASYLIVEDISGWEEPLNQLIKAVIQTQTKAFGAFLLLEVWAGRDSETEHEPPEFQIYAHKNNAPATLLENFESALLRISVNSQEPAVSVQFVEEISSPELNPILASNELEDLHCIHLGLEVKPVYRDQAGALFPFELQQIHHQLSRALKCLFYEFIHLRTTHRPVHYHELGRQAMTQDVWDTDQQLAAISSKFDLLLHVTPVNVPAAWKQFQQTQYRLEPEFLYRARPCDPGLLKRELFSIPIEEIEDPTLAHIFTEKRQELDRHITLVTDRNTERFLLGSRQIYGDVEDDFLKLAETLLQDVPAESGRKTGQKEISAEELYTHAKQEIAYYQLKDERFNPAIELRDDVSGVIVSHGDFLIGSDATIRPGRLEAILAHEIGTHVLTYYNGRQQPFHELYAGMAGYEAMQEGLALLAEYLVGGLDPVRLRILAARVLAVKSMTAGADFVEIFHLLFEEHSFSPYNAFLITMRIFRGGGYTKDIVYLRGLVKILDDLAAGQDLEPLYLGKIAHDHLPFIEELRWRKVLRPPALRPRFLDTQETEDRLKRLRSGATVVTLARGDIV